MYRICCKCKCKCKGKIKGKGKGKGEGKGKGKGKVVSVHAVKMYRGSRDIALLILNLSTSRR
jgi:hypothetical protein